MIEEYTWFLSEKVFSLSLQEWETKWQESRLKQPESEIYKLRKQVVKGHMFHKMYILNILTNVSSFSFFRIKE